MREFIYKLFRLEYERSFCASCEKLMLLLEDEKRRHNKLIDNLITPKVEIPASIAPDWQPRPSKHTPWSVVQQRLEAADRLKAEEIKKAQAITDAKRKIEALEKEVGIPTLEEEVEKANA